MIARLIRIAGFAIFAISFALPAVRVGPPASHDSALPGWFCAYIASLIAPWDLMRSSSSRADASTWMVFFSGLINPLVIAVLVLCKWQRLARARFVIMACMAPCFIGTWIYFAKESMKPTVGHYLWVAGAVLFVSPDLVAILQRSTPAEHTTSEPDAAGLSREGR